MQIWLCTNCKVPRTEFCFTPCSVPERVSSTVHQTNCCCAHRWKHLFNPSPLGFPFTVCVHWTPMGSKCSLWDCTNGPCAEVRMLFVFMCMWVCVLIQYGWTDLLCVWPIGHSPHNWQTKREPATFWQSILSQWDHCMCSFITFDLLLWEICLKWKQRCRV